MKPTINKQDPLGILESTKSIVEQAKYVKIIPEKIKGLVKQIKEYNEKHGFENAEESFGKAGNLSDDIQLVFIEDAVNFCFWPDEGESKWRMEFPAGNIVDGGWYGLKTCFERALFERVPILDASFLETISMNDVNNIFRGVDGIEIPLLSGRQKNLQEAGNVLREQFNGKFVNALAVAENDAIKLVELIIENFSSFNDIACLNNKEIRFYKRAQICAFDISYVLAEYNKPRLKRLNELTAFADYKLPQILRLFGVLEYADKLAGKVDKKIKLSAGSREEVEIRAATIWAIELAQKLAPDLSVAQIDNLLWLISQDEKQQRRARPYHRTRTIYY